MWTPSPVRLGLTRPRLGQTNNLTTRMAEAVIEKAEPKLRQVMWEERKRFADGIATVLPYAAVSLGTVLATGYLVDPKDTYFKVGGYAAATLALALGIWQTVGVWRGSGSPTPDAASPETGILQDVVSTFIDPASRQFASAIIAEATPRVEKIVNEERQRAADALQATIPWFALSSAAVLATMFLVPSKPDVAKMGGYMGAAGLALFGIYRGAEVERGSSSEGAKS